MTKHMRLIVSVLFIVIIILTIAITRFYSSTDKLPAVGNTQPSVVKKLGTDASGNRIFLDSNGLYGIIDSNSRLTVSPEWHEINFTDGDLCIASKRVRGKKLYGCIDHEGNIEVPFVYSSIDRVNVRDQTLYIAKTFDNQKNVVYDADFTPCFSRPWDEYSVSNNNELVLTFGNATYRYSADSNGLVLANALISGQTMKHSYDFEIISRNRLSELTFSAIEKMDHAVSSYIEYAFTGDSTVLADIDAVPSALFLTLFPEDHQIIAKRLSNISDVSVYSVISDDNLLHYAVSVTAGISVSYKNNEGKIKRLRGNHKAEIVFEGSSVNSLRVVSAQFKDDKPNYPKQSA
ncbi:MAG: WG repeat-containing protein [Ruminococcus sp.]|uniref:WG repeat-containing protein n=1 Tax=Ruminococcus sp. TaxID=41978 RepID=UPI0025DF56FC|nr:WG repeat-containing protein [Ruminococcus sp.]MCR5599303.1 WG repeat-containing protein [Ruminococcus sp.]